MGQHEVVHCSRSFLSKCAFDASFQREIVGKDTRHINPKVQWGKGKVMQFVGAIDNPFQRQRKTRIISAIGVLLDELDADGLRDVIDEAQRRMKKLR